MVFLLKCQHVYFLSFQQNFSGACPIFFILTNLCPAQQDLCDRIVWLLQLETLAFVSELVYESHLKCDARKGLRVRIPPKAFFLRLHYSYSIAQRANARHFHGDNVAICQPGQSSWSQDLVCLWIDLCLEFGYAARSHSA